MYPVLLEELLPLLEDPDVATRRRTAQAIGDLGVTAIPALVERLSYPNETLRATSAKALAAIGRRYPGSLEDEGVLSALACALGDDDPIVRLSAVGALGIIGGKAVPWLEQGLSSEDFALKFTLASTLGSIGGATVIPALNILLADSDPSVAGVARSALAVIAAGGAHHHVT